MRISLTKRCFDSGFSRELPKIVIPAFAGMTENEFLGVPLRISVRPVSFPG
jgi:hypothetical protein